MPLTLDDLLMPAQPGANRAPDHLRIEEPIGRFSRLADMADNPDDRLEIDVAVGPSQSGWPQIEGRVHGAVALVCQRCLGRLLEPVDVDLRLALVPEGSEQAVPEGFEAWVEAADSRSRLRELIEDEVMLALPLIARHDDRSACGELSSLLIDDAQAGAEDIEAKGDETNPFAVLKGLKGPGR